MKIAKTFLMLFAASALIFTGCKKEDTVEPTSNTNTSNLQKLSNDEQNVENVSDAILNDANAFMSTALKSTADIPCNATADSVVIANDSATMYIRYHGNDCSNTFNRTGLVTIRHKVGQPWWEAGATVIIRMINFHVIRLADNHWMTINGVHFYQNVSGSNAPTIVHKVWGTIVTLFDDTTTSTWNLARQKSLTGTLGTLILTVDGFGTAGDRTNLIDWGITREGKAFYSQVQQIITMKQECGWRPCSGIKFHEIPDENKSATITFGFNNNNQPIGPNECPTKFKLDWQHNGNSGTFYLQLPW